MKRWMIGAAVLALIGGLVPYSSRHPDVVQRVLGLQGGVESFWKAVGGIAAAGGLAMGVLWAARKAAKRP